MSDTAINFAIMKSYQSSIDDLGMDLDQVVFCVIDLETTGSATDDAIIEIGAVKTCGYEIYDVFHTLVNPGVGISQGVTSLTGITNRLVAGAPHLSTILPSLLEFMAGTVLVAHNARFDVGFLKRACKRHGYFWPSIHVIDTLALARHMSSHIEVPNWQLSTLAIYFNTDTRPCHRALDDARATVDVLHGLLKIAPRFGVNTFEDLRALTLQVSPQRRAKRTWASALPRRPGVYFFYTDPRASRRTPLFSERELLYVGTSTNLRRRVSSYFTASEKRAPIEEMIRIASGVDYIECVTPLEAAVLELRLIQAHSPRYNRRSRRQEKVWWITVTTEKFPRLCVVNRVKNPTSLHWGPFTSKQSALDACAAVYEHYPLRQCSRQISDYPQGCLLADMERCMAPCLDESRHEKYLFIVQSLMTALTHDVRPTLAAMGEKIAELSKQQRYEEAGAATMRARTFIRSVVRWHRLASIARCPQIIAAHQGDDSWQIHVIRYGRLVAAATAPPGNIPQNVLDQTLQSAQTVFAPDGELPACTIEEAELVAAWLERPDVRLLDVTGEWSWPAYIGIDINDLPSLLYRNAA